MVSALYAVLGALLLIKFSFDVVRLRWMAQKPGWCTSVGCC